MTTPPIADLYLKTLISIDEGEGLKPATESRLVAQNDVVHVITAWNPGDARPTRLENDDANEALYNELVRRGTAPVHAIGVDPDSPHFEESWAVAGLTDDEARAIGAAHGQVAIFRLTRDAQTVLACFEDWTTSRSI